jgi:hypothetical protein
MTPKERSRMNEIFSMDHNHPDYYRALDELKELMPSENRDHNIAVLGAFVMEGIRDYIRTNFVDFEDFIAETYGWYEFTYEATQHVSLMQDLYEAGCSALDGCAPSSYPYEVVNGFGSWFAEYTHKEGMFPTTAECESWVHTETYKFFN